MESHSSKLRFGNSSLLFAFPHSPTISCPSLSSDTFIPVTGRQHHVREAAGQRALVRRLPPRQLAQAQVVNVVEQPHVAGPHLHLHPPVHPHPPLHRRRCMPRPRRWRLAQRYRSLPHACSHREDGEVVEQESDLRLSTEEQQVVACVGDERVMGASGRGVGEGGERGPDEGGGVEGEEVSEFEVELVAEVEEGQQGLRQRQGL
eukprot:764944-Hanusia_phi.AAC.6